MFFDDIERGLLEGRALAESLMKDRVVVTRSSGLVTDEDGFTSESAETIYQGKAKSQRPGGWSRSQVGDSDTAIAPLEFHLPFEAAGGVRVGDIVMVVKSSDPAMVGRRYAISGEFMKTFATARRFAAEVVGR